MGSDLKPGPEMDRKVAEAVRRGAIESAFGRWCGATPTGWEPVSTQVAAAIAALEATGCPRRSINVDEYCLPERRVAVQLWWPNDNGTHFREYDGEGATLPEAACRAILAWAKGKEGSDG